LFFFFFPRITYSSSALSNICSCQGSYEPLFILPRESTHTTRSLHHSQQRLNC
jgi:hypothetical protein